jgi:hypothetical protein
VNGYDQYIGIKKNIRGVRYILVGCTLNLLAPIPGVIADKRARQAVSRANLSGQRGRRQIGIGALYGVGLELAALGVGGGLIDADSLAILLVITSKIVLDASIFFAYVRVRRFERLPALMPIVGRNSIGLGLSGTF